jgi:hypothetical protein
LKHQTESSDALEDKRQGKQTAGQIMGYPAHSGGLCDLWGGNPAASVSLDKNGVCWGQE